MELSWLVAVPGGEPWGVGGVWPFGCVWPLPSLSVWVAAPLRFVLGAFVAVQVPIIYWQLQLRLKYNCHAFHRSLRCTRTLSHDSALALRLPAQAVTYSEL